MADLATHQTCKSIFIGIPTCRRYEPFWQSLSSFLMGCASKYSFELCVVPNKTIAEARNEIADRFLASDKDYLLFLDDDHVGHTVAMLDSLLAPVEDCSAKMVGIKCYMKVFPYLTNTSIYSNVDYKALGLQEGQGKYIPVEFEKGYNYLHLIGFGMTIVTREAFKALDKPYFVSKDNGKEDNYFCDNLVKKDILPVGCFDHTLEHQGIGIHNAKELRDKGYAELEAKFPNMKVLVS